MRITASPLLLASLATLLVVGVAWLVLGGQQPGIDDADIARVYGRNLAQGHGLVYTPGFERVEGYSSTTWMLVWAAAEAISPWPQLTVTIVALTLCVLCVTLFLGLVARLAPGREGLRVALVLLATIPGWFAWNTLTLMDLGSWTLGIMAFLWLQGRTLVDGRRFPGEWPLALVLVLLALTRPEGLALAPGLLVLAVLGRVAAGEDPRRTLRAHLLPLFGVAGAIGGLLTFRLETFGYPFPNTYYAKVSPDRLYNLVEGLRYVLGFVQDVPWMVIFAPVLVGVLAMGPALLSRREREDPGRVLAVQAAALAAAGLALPLVEGGDHFGAHRLLQPFLLPAALPAFWALGRLRARTGGDLLTPVPGKLQGLVILAAVAFTWITFRLESGLEREFRIAHGGRRLGAALTSAFEPPERPVVGVITAGGVALTYEGRVLDLMGLNWTAMGHSESNRRGVKNHAAFDPDVFWTARPELVVPHLHRREPEPGARPTNDFGEAVLGSLIESERFQAEYEVRAFESPLGWILAYARRDWPQLAQTKSPVVTRDGALVD